MATQPDAGATASELRVVIGRLVRRLRAEYTISLSHIAVLAQLDREGDRTTSALAAAERVRPQSMAETIADLEGEGLVTRRPDPNDRRQMLIGLSALGRERLFADRARREGWLATAITESLDAHEREILARAVPLLGRIADL